MTHTAPLAYTPPGWEALGFKPRTGEKVNGKRWARKAFTTLHLAVKMPGRGGKWRHSAGCWCWGIESLTLNRERTYGWCRLE